MQLLVLYSSNLHLRFSVEGDTFTRMHSHSVSPNLCVGCTQPFSCRSHARVMAQYDTVTMLKSGIIVSTYVEREVYTYTYLNVDWSG